MKVKLLALGTLALAAALVLPTLVTAAGIGVAKLEAAMDGGEEFPDKGDPDGTGLGKVTIKQPKGEVCFDISFEQIENPFAAHVHKGKFGENEVGEIEVPFFDGSKEKKSPIKGCVEAKERLLGKIAKKPSNYYLNLHNEEYPGGAIRGQLVDR